MSFFGNKNKGSVSGGGTGSTTTIIQQSLSYAVATIAERDAIQGVKNGSICIVQNASADPTVANGYAVYQRLGTVWVKISDENIMKMRNTESIQETEIKQFVTTQEKEMIHETKQKLDESTMLQQSDTAPQNTDVLWVAE